MILFIGSSGLILQRNIYFGRPFCCNIQSKFQQFYWIYIGMSRYTNKTMFNRSSGSSSFRSKAQTSVPTVFLAINKLKFEQDKLLEQHKRHRVLNRQISRERVVSLNHQKKSQFFTIVKESAELDKEIKKSHQNKQIEQLKVRYSLNMRNRQQNKKMIEGVRKSFQQVNHELYEQIRQKKKQNEELVKTERAKYLQSRVVNRVQANEQKDMRRRSISGFYESRSSERKSSKSQEIAELLKKSEEKHKMYDAAVSRSSRIRENKLKTSRITSDVKSEKNPENQAVPQA